MNFAEQSVVFLEHLAARKRRPVKPATLCAYEGYLRNWILPVIGNADLETFGNGAMRAFAASLTEKTLGPKSVLEITSLVKQVIGSAVDTEGDSLYPRKWNHEFIDLPTIQTQAQPVVTPEQLKKALSRKEKHRAFYAFLAGTGLRIGEALAVRFGDDGVHTCWDPDRAVVRVRTSIWQGKEQSPKTPAAIREVDLDPRLNHMLSLAMTGPQLAGQGEFVFKSSTGKPAQLDALRDRSLKKLGIHGFHAFRRFRITRLRELGTPEDIIRYWVGHAGSGITDRYSKLAENVQLRKRWAAQAGLGFDVPETSVAMWGIDEKISLRVCDTLSQ